MWKVIFKQMIGAKGIIQKIEKTNLEPILTPMLANLDQVMRSIPEGSLPSMLADPEKRGDLMQKLMGSMPPELLMALGPMVPDLMALFKGLER